MNRMSGMTIPEIKNLTRHSKNSTVLDNTYFLNALRTTEHSQKWHDSILKQSKNFNLDLEKMFFDVKKTEGSFPQNLDSTIKLDLATDQKLIGVPVDSIDFLDPNLDSPGSTKAQKSYAACVAQTCQKLLDSNPLNKISKDTVSSFDSSSDEDFPLPLHNPSKNLSKQPSNFQSTFPQKKSIRLLNKSNLLQNNFPNKNSSKVRMSQPASCSFSTEVFPELPPHKMDTISNPSTDEDEKYVPKSSPVQKRKTKRTSKKKRRKKFILSKNVQKNKTKLIDSSVVSAKLKFDKNLTWTQQQALLKHKDVDEIT